MPTIIPLKLKFEGAQVDREGLDLYDGAQSFLGFAQAIQMVTHAYVRDEVIAKSTALKGAEIFFESPRRGSVIFDLKVALRERPKALATSPDTFYDFLRYAFSRAVGKYNVDPETNSVDKVVNRDNDIFDELSERIEGSLQRGHRAVDNGVARVVLARPRSPLVVFNKVTSQWVNTRDENPAVEEFKGSVTRYNSISHNARAYIKELNRVIPVRPDAQFPGDKLGILSWSLHGNTVKGDKEVKFWGSRIESANGDPKRLVISDVDYAHRAGN